MSINFSTPFAKKTGNQIPDRNTKFYNFALPAIGTCLGAPEACKGHVINRKPVCFAVRPMTNWPFTQKVSQMNGGNCIYKQFANLYLSFDKNKEKYINYLETILCPELIKSFRNYEDNGINAYSSKNQLVNSCTPSNIWEKLSIFYNGNNDDMLPYIVLDKINFEQYMIGEINKIIKISRSCDIYFRIHYSGDFYSEEYFNAWVNIAENFNSSKSIHFMAYTKEIAGIEQWLNNMGRGLYGGADGINIKLVFSEMSEFVSSLAPDININTSSTDIEAYNRLNSKQAMMKYVCVPDNAPAPVCNTKCGAGYCFKCYNDNTCAIYVQCF